MDKSEISDHYYRMANEVEALRVRLCAYGADENHTCDCKYGLGMRSLAGTLNISSSELTGCPEMRDIIRGYRALAEKYAS